VSTDRDPFGRECLPDLRPIRLELPVSPAVQVGGGQPQLVRGPTRRFGREPSARLSCAAAR